MNRLQQPAAVARQLFDINLETVNEMVSLTGRGFRDYLDLNAKYLGQVLPPRSIEHVMQVNRQYSEALAESLRRDLSERGQILKGAFEKTTHALRDGFDGTSATAAAATSTPATSADPNLPLETVKGIGARFAEQLRAAGIESLADLAALEPAALEHEDHPLAPLAARLLADQWIEQAQALTAD